MEWIKIIGGIAGGGWGSLAAIIAGLVGMFILYKAYQTYKINKATHETKQKEVDDQLKIIKDTTGDKEQQKKDEDKVNELTNHTLPQPWHRGPDLGS